jgi:hypothetical protein
LHTPHFEHFSPVLSSRTAEIHLKGGNLLNNAINPPSGQILHHERLKKKAAAVTMTRIATFNDVT